MKKHKQLNNIVNLLSYEKHKFDITYSYYFKLLSNFGHNRELSGIVYKWLKGTYE